LAKRVFAAEALANGFKVVPAKCFARTTRAA
jgi:hypothetical protein